jgi:hypothetical protein
MGIDLPFYAAKLQQVWRRRVSPSLTRHPEQLRTLLRDGVVMIEGFLDRTEVRTMVDQIGSSTDLMTDRCSAGIVKRHGRYLLLDPRERVPATRRFFDHPAVAGLAQAYLSPRVVPDRPVVQLKVDVGEASKIDYFHIDEWRYLLSAFLFLTDVGPDQAPMIYLRGSHKPRLWRLNKEKEFFHYYGKQADGQYANEESPYCGCVLPPEVRRLRERHGFQALTCTGPAGTLVVFDNLGLHRSSVLRRDHRLVLSQYWTLPGGAES